MNLELKTGLRWTVAIEGVTLFLLVCIAVPLKRLSGWDEAVKVMGPVHGLAFLAFIYSLINGLAAGTIGFKIAARLFVGALIPFGGLINERWLARQQD